MSTGQQLGRLLPSTEHIWTPRMVFVQETDFPAECHFFIPHCGVARTGTGGTAGVCGGQDGTHKKSRGTGCLRHGRCGGGEEAQVILRRFPGPVGWVNIRESKRSENRFQYGGNGVCQKLSGDDYNYQEIYHNGLQTGIVRERQFSECGSGRRRGECRRHRNKRKHTGFRNRGRDGTAVRGIPPGLAEPSAGIGLQCDSQKLGKPDLCGDPAYHHKLYF